MIKLFKKILGSDGGNQEKIDSKNYQAHSIKNQMTTDILRIKRNIDKINKDTNQKLKQVSIDLESVTYNIAIAQGGRKRGMK